LVDRDLAKRHPNILVSETGLARRRGKLSKTYKRVARTKGVPRDDH